MEAKRPTIRDVAELSGVSIASVSYALGKRREQRRMTQDTFEKIVDAASRLGYVPNAAAATLARGHSDVVLVALDPTFVGDVSERSNRVVIETLTSRGYRPLLYAIESHEDLLAVAAAIRPVGVMHLAFLPERIREDLRRVGAQFVFGLESTDPDQPEARPWEADIGAAQADFAAAQGYARVVYAMPEATPRMPVLSDRLAGLRARCSELSLGDPLVLRFALARESIATALARVPLTEGPTIVCAFDDRTAIGVLGAAAELGLEVPRDLGVIGADNTAESSLVRPSLTTVEFDETREAELTRQWIEAAISGEAGHLRDRWMQAPFHPSVVTRESA